MLLHLKTSRTLEESNYVVKRKMVKMRFRKRQRNIKIVESSEEEIEKDRKKIFTSAAEMSRANTLRLEEKVCLIQ